ncbi:hypothetical protein D7030_01705 [Flavobacteriaceae bacterium AU392]|nr:hypothetical protein D1817_08180 [Flavobacteriaceae bacterium]RKM85411.1 hypothetical protein D7030_01705 [Flavobacteriaceae bacterium AU392]
MEEDNIKTIFKSIDSIHNEVDFEDVILHKIESQIQVKKQIVRNRKYGLLGILITLILVILFVWFYYKDLTLSIDFRNPLMQVGLCAFVLILLFLQLETASSYSRSLKMDDS